MVSEPKAFLKRLRDAGAILPKDDDERDNLLSAVARSDPSEEWVYEAQTGWTKGRKAFVFVDGVIGDVKTKIIGVNWTNSVRDPSGRLSKSGSWKLWRDIVAEPARLSTILMFAICVAPVPRDSTMWETTCPRTLQSVLEGASRVPLKNERRRLKPLAMKCFLQVPDRPLDRTTEQECEARRVARS